MRFLLLVLLTLSQVLALIEDSDAQFAQPRIRSGRRLSQTDSAVIEVSNERQLRNAFASLGAGDTIQLGSGEYALSRRLVLTVPNVTIIGREGTSIRCPSDDSGLTIRSSGVNVVLMTFERCENNAAVIIEGSDDDDGNRTNVILNGVVFQNNAISDFASLASALLIRRCGSSPCTASRPSVEVRNSTFSDNESVQGGCIFCEDCMLRLNGSVFHNNVASFSGGAIFARGADAVLEVVASQFMDNTVSGRGQLNEIRRGDGSSFEGLPYFTFVFPANAGGCIFVRNIQNLSVVNSVFRSNRAIAGGAITLEMDERLSNLEEESRRSRARISDCVFENNQANQTGRASTVDMESNHGGAVYIVSGFSQLESFELENCTFRNNSARYGGAVHLVSVPESSFTIDRCFFADNWAVQAGGAMVFRNTQGLEMINTTCIRNSAELGGAIMLTNNADLTGVGLLGIRVRSGDVNLFLENTALYGGGIMCVGCGVMRLNDVNFTRNSARRAGGGLYVLDTASEIRVHQSHFHSNVATLGGGAAFRAIATGSVSSISRQFGNTFINNTAIAGGGIFVEGSRQQENRVQIVNCLFEENRAISVVDASFPFADDSLRNRAADSTSRLLLQQRNDVDEEEETEQYQFSACGNGGGGGICLVFNSVPVDSLSDVRLQNITLNRNTALVGGGIFLNIAGAGWNQVVLQSCPIRLTPTTNPCRIFHLLNMTYLNNVAEFGGGGLFVTEPETIVVGCPDSAPTDWEQFLTAWENEQLTDTYCSRFEGNSVTDARGVYGPDVASDIHALELVNPTSTIIMNHTGGERLLPPCPGCISNRTEGVQVAVRDVFNQTITGGIADSRARIVLVSTSILGEQIYTARKGIININDTLGVGVNRSSTVDFQYEGNRSISTRLGFITRACYPGEHQTNNECEACLPDHYSFHPNSTCRICESRAKCTGGATLVPDEGYWHSTPFSPQFHECIIKKACDYTNRTEILSNYSADRSKMDSELSIVHVYLDEEGRKPVFETYRQCSEGYTGPLCGSCMPGYGHFGGGECVECPETDVAAGFFVFLTVLWTFSLVAVNVMLTFSSTAKQILMAIEEQGHMSSSMPSRSIDPGPEDGQVEMVGIRHEQENHNGDVGGENGLPRQMLPRRRPPVRRPRNTDHVVAVEKLTEIGKILINYLQVTSVALNINATWHGIVKHLLSIETMVVSATSASYYVPLDCSFDSNDDVDPRVPNSIKAFWLRVFLPGIYWVVFLGLIQLHSVIWRKPSQRSRHTVRNDVVAGVVSRKTYSIVVTLFLVYYCYINLTSEFMRAVNCAKVDNEASDPPHEYDRYAIETGRRVWAEDTRLRCFKGDHTMTGVLGVLGLIFSAMVIVSILFWFPRHKDKLEDPNFIARFGFIYRGYKKEHWFTISWEAAIGIRKALIAAAVVFAFPLGPNLQAVCALGVVILALTIHWIVWPFQEYYDSRGTTGTKHPNVPGYSGDFLKLARLDMFIHPWQELHNSISLNTLEAGSLLMSIVVFYSGVLFNDDNTSEGAKYTMAIFTLITNLLFISYAVFRLYAGVHMALDMHFDFHASGDVTLPGNIAYPRRGGICAFVRKIVALSKYWYYHREEARQTAGGIHTLEETRYPRRDRRIHG